MDFVVGNIRWLSPSVQRSRVEDNARDPFLVSPHVGPDYVETSIDFDNVPVISRCTMQKHSWNARWEIIPLLPMQQKTDDGTVVE
jgi:hypothetical protein